MFLTFPKIQHKCVFYKLKMPVASKCLFTQKAIMSWFCYIILDSKPEFSLLKKAF